jgi:hypothetical protein
MKKTCLLVLTIFGIITLGIYRQPALAATNSVTLGYGPMDFNLEYERALTDNMTLSLHTGTVPVLWGADLYGIEIRKYFKGNSIDGIYAGLGYLHVNDHADEVLGGWLDTEDCNANVVQLSLGYKKATGSGFTYEAGIIGMNNLSTSELSIAGRLAIGYSW